MRADGPGAGVAGDASFPDPPVAGTDAEWLEWATISPGAMGLGIVPTALDLGGARLRVDAPPTPLNPNGALHGGMVAAVCDQAMALAIMRRMQHGRVIVTSTLNVDYLRPAMPTIEVTAWVDRTAHSVVFARAEVRSGDTVAALASGTFVPVDQPRKR